MLMTVKSNLNFRSNLNLSTTGSRGIVYREVQGKENEIWSASSAISLHSRFLLLPHLSTGFVMPDGHSHGSSGAQTTQSHVASLQVGLLLGYLKWWKSKWEWHKCVSDRPSLAQVPLSQQQGPVT
jgi:hypothetical protein